MTKILAFADTQIGVNTVDLADQRAVLDKIVQVAIDREVDLVIHGGDVFEGPVVLPEHLKCFVDGVAPLWDNGIDMLVIRGNGRHDMATRDVNALDVLRKVTGIYVSDRPECIGTLGIEISTEVDLDIVTLPWVKPSHVLASMNGAVDHDRANATISEMLVRIARDLKPDGHAFLVAHWAISGSQLPTGLDVEEMREPVLPWADLDALGYDIVIGGHIHQPQVISDPDVDQGPAIVLGSPQQLNHGETGEHGCWLVEIDDAGARPEFIPIDSPRFQTITFDHPDPFAQIGLSDNIGWAVDGDIVRVRYTATEEQAQQIDHGYLRRRLLEAGAKRVQIEPNILRVERARAPEITEALDMVEALTLWAEANEVGPEMQHRMVGRLQEWRAA